MPKSFTGSFATCTNPSSARPQGLELFAGAWSCSRKGSGDSKHIQTMSVKPKMREIVQVGVPGPGAFRFGRASGAPPERVQLHAAERSDAEIACPVRRELSGLISRTESSQIRDPSIRGWKFDIPAARVAVGNVWNDLHLTSDGKEPQHPSVETDVGNSNTQPIRSRNMKINRLPRG